MSQTHWIPHEESTQQNLNNIRLIQRCVVAIVLAVSLFVGLLVGQVFIVVPVGAIVSWLIIRALTNSAEENVLTAIGGVPASELEHARLFNVVDGLCVTSGDHRPALVIVNAEFPVALAVGFPGSDGTLVVSTGFCEQMDRVETEAVMAHLLWRLRTNNAALNTFLLSFSSVMSKVGLASISRRVVSRMSDASHVLIADIAGCEATRYPPAMESALQKCLVNTGTTANVPHPILWFAVPDTFSGDTMERSKLRSLGFSYPSLPDRIAVLKEI